MEFGKDYELKHSIEVSITNKLSMTRIQMMVVSVSTAVGNVGSTRRGGRMRIPGVSREERRVLGKFFSCQRCDEPILTMMQERASEELVSALSIVSSVARTAFVFIERTEMCFCGVVWRICLAVGKSNLIVYSLDIPYRLLKLFSPFTLWAFIFAGRFCSAEVKAADV